MTDNVTAWSTLGLAIATLVVVIIALHQASLTRDAVAVAQADSREAIKARIDQRAPHVTFVIRSAAFATFAWNEDVVDGAPVDESRASVASLACWVHAVNEGRSRGWSSYRPAPSSPDRGTRSQRQRRGGLPSRRRSGR